MARGRQLKTQLRQYSSTSHTNDPPPASSPPSSVTDKLTKLRIEQSRAVANRRQRQQVPQQSIVLDHGLPPWTTATSTLSDNSSSSNNIPTYRRAAGPPPPPSWTRPRPAPAPSPRYHRPIPATTFPTLVQLCCRQLTTLQASLIRPIQHLPVHVKQCLLLEWSSYSPSLVTDATMPLFEKTAYEELWLEASQVSLQRLIRAFWKVETPTVDDDDDDDDSDNDNDDTVVDDWEDLHDNDDDDDDGVPRCVLSTQEEQWSDLYTTLAPSLSTRIILSSPWLGQSLVSLNVSWTPPSYWPKLAYLMVSTLPHLMWLYSAGCLDRTQGPQVVSLLSHGMRKLKFWDLGFYDDWLDVSLIDWQRDLLELKTLCVSSSKRADLLVWLKHHNLSRIKLIWID
ncbi:hypothetical protein [Absidia glauca]|uniref:Uncharacterized protein n=1 Tax=Absidia glauca TaxID=4829 RepID=A0A168R1K3_ABSGL|nr:hypothetical protein [Absidia glauca]